MDTTTPYLYFDNSASYPLHPEVLEMIKPTYTKLFANPSSSHGLGQKTWEMLEAARSSIAQSVKAPSASIYFSSGATESINILLQGYARFLESSHSEKNEIIISSIEHPAVLNTVLALKYKGFKIHQLATDSDGVILKEELLKALNSKTAMVCIIDVNNEIGTKQNIDSLAQIVKTSNPEIFFVADSAQSLGKMTSSYDLSLIDAFFISGHKIGAPKNSGFFYLNPEFRIIPIFFGGGQESSYRPGTTDAAMAIFLAKALNESNTHLEKNLAYVKQLGISLTKTLKDLQVTHTPVVNQSVVSPYICSLIIPEIKGNQLISMLSKKNIYISGGSACSSSCGTKSRILEALKKTDNEAISTVRISFSIYNTIEDVQKLAVAICDCTQMIKEKKAAGNFLSSTAP